ncbi:MAG TPA: IPT/TIG domain-containing protein, partial [Steroidobacteraceae bacterium]|nr:IPT/TIG domain-containing protein [Steroidobacteraceae bacterium]
MGIQAVAGMAPAGRRQVWSVGGTDGSGLRRKPHPLRRAATVALALILGSGLHLSRTGNHWELSVPTAQADNIQYVYDELGRLVQAADLTSGQAVQYTYDAAGNITSRTAVALSTPSVGYVSTQQGSAGSQVTIDGTGFSTTPADDIVSFNGTPATVVSATGTELVVTVPTGATSGPITVQIGGATITTGTFTVTSGVNGPAITSLFPAIGAAGAAVTVSGTGFDPNPVHDRVQFNTSLASVTGSSATSITTALPANTGSGKVQVMTPNGIAISPMDFIVVPSGYSASSVGSTGRLPTDGSLTSLTLAASHISVQLFDGSAGDLLTIGIGSISVASATLKIFKPDGTSLTSGAVSSSGQGVQLPKLSTTGTYTVVVDPGANSGSIALSIVKPLRATLALDGTPTVLTVTPPGRRTLLTFAGTQGAYANIALSGVTVSTGTISVIAPNGAVLQSAPFGTSNGGGGIEPELPQNGLYTVLIDPTGSVGGSLNVALTTSSSPTLGIGQSVNVNLPNQTPIDVTFQATAGQYLSLGISENQSGVSGATFKVLKPDGTTLTSSSFTGSTCGGGIGCSGYSGKAVINLGSLPMGGTYTVVVQQTGTGSGTITLTLSAPVTKTLSVGTTSSVTASLTGQAMQLTFSGEAGQFISFAVSENQDLIPGATITVSNPNGSVLTTGSFSGQPCTPGGVGCTGITGTAVMNPGPLLMTGTYTILVQQTTGGSGTLTFTASAPVSQALSAGTSSTVTASLQGQGMQLTFAGAKGQYLALALSELNDLIPGATVIVLNPDGSQLTSGSFTATWCGGFGCQYYSGASLLNFGPLPQDGTYTVLIQQATSNLLGNNLNTGTLTVTLSSPVQVAASAGSSASGLASIQGQPMQLTFTGSPGQYFSLAVQEHDEGDIPGATITVFAPDGTIAAKGSLTTQPGPLCTQSCQNGDTTVNLGPLTQAGTYTVLIQQAGIGGTGGLEFTLSNPAVGVLTTGNTVSPVVNLAGQSFQETFSGAAGQFFSLSVHEYDEGNIVGAAITVLAADGTTVTKGTLTTTPGAGCAPDCDNGDALVNMGPLTASGTYTVLVQQTNAGTGGLDLALSNPADGGVLNPGTPTSVPTLLLGQALQVTFSGVAGAAIALHVEEDSGSNISGAGLSIFNPDGTPLASGTLNTTACSGCGYTGVADLYPSVLPQTGTYRVVAQQKSAGTGTLTFTATGIQPATGFTNAYSTSTAGQAISFTFPGTAGQSASLALSNLVVSANTPTDVFVNVTKPDGTFLMSSWCHTNGFGCVLSLLSLPQSGTYQVQVSPANSSQTMSFTTTFSSDVAGALTLNTPMPVSLSSMGQSGVFTFTATAGETVAVNESGVTTVPAGVSMGLIVYNSAGTQVGSTSGSSFATLNLPNLPADTYRVLVYPATPATSNLQLTLESAAGGALPADGSSTSYSTPAPGQNGYLTFSGTVGQSASFALSNLAVSANTPTDVFVSINKPDGSSLISSWCHTSGAGCELSLLNLPQSGTYQVQVTPANSSQTMSFAATFSTDVTGALVPNTTMPVSLGSMGQSGVFTFTTTAGQTVALSESGVTTTPAGVWIGMTVYNSAGTQVGSTSGSSFATLNLPNLPADTYHVLVCPGSPATSSLHLALEGGVGGPLPADGTSRNYSTSAPGQNAYFTFSGTAGQSVSLALTNLVLTPSSPGYAQVYIYKPDGSQYGEWNCWTTSTQGC